MDEWTDEVDDRPRDLGSVVAFFLDDLQCTDNEANRQASLKAERIAEIVRLAREHPELYVERLQGKEALEFAERSVLLDIALRLRSSEDQVRGLLFVAEEAKRHLPNLWREARDGFASMHLVERTVGALARVRAPEGVPPAAQEAERESMRLIDEATAVWVHSCPPAAFRRRLKVLVDRLDPVDASAKHSRAMRDRKVFIEDAADGMSRFIALIPTIDAIAAKRRMTSTAKHLEKDRREGRTRDQIRADLFCDWLLGKGTETAVKTRVFVTVPVQLLTAPDAEGATSPDAEGPEQARLVGHGPIDPVTAKQIFLDAKAFRRVITDPVRGVILDMDRRTYRPTKAQRDWLILQHGTCARDGCSRLAVDSEIDHDTPWSLGGKTTSPVFDRSARGTIDIST